MICTRFALYPVLPMALLIVLLIAAAGFIVWQEARRKHRFRTLRIAAAVLFISMVTAILLRPRYSREHSASILLLTPGFTTSIADSLVRTNPAITILRTPGALPYRNAAVIDSWQALSEKGGDIQYIAGQGLPQHALDILGSTAYTYFPAPAPKGIIQLAVPATIVANRAGKIEGIFSEAESSTSLVLTGPGGNEDSIQIAAQRRQPFTLTVHPKQPGNFIYTLTARDSSGYESKQAIPLTVQPQKPYNILFLQRYPTFETQYLKRFLAREHGLVMRYQLSRNAYRYEYANHAAQNADRLTTDILRTFDLVFLDSDVLHALPAGETQALQNAITNGLGVLLLFNDLPANVNHLKSIVPINFKSVATDTARITSSTGRSLTLPAWPVRAAAEAGVVPITTSKGATLAGYRYHGLGKAGFQLLQETYRLTLEGDSIAYSNLWSPLLEQTARTAAHKSEIHLTTPFPRYADQPVNIDVITTADTTPTLLADSIAIPLTEDLTIDNLFHATTWAAATGWHTITLPNDSTEQAYYISAPTEWSALAATQATHNTKAHASTSAKISSDHHRVHPHSTIDLLPATGPDCRLPLAHPQAVRTRIHLNRYGCPFPRTA